MARDPAERALERETEDYERQRREDRVKDHAPATSSELYGDRGRVATLPVLLGGLGHGRPWPEGVAPVLAVGETEDEPGEEFVYRPQKFAPPLATVAVRFCAWDGLSPPQAIAKAWDWLAERALPPPLPLNASDFERPLSDDERWRIEAMEAVLVRHRGTLLRLMTGGERPPVEVIKAGTVESMMVELLAAADTGI